MSPKLHNYIKSHRKRAGLTQKELAFLLGSRCGTKVSRYECNIREPNIYTVFAFEVVFRVSAQDLCPGMYAKVEQKVLPRAKVLLKELSERNDADQLSELKISFIQEMIAREGPAEPDSLWENPKNLRLF